MNSIEIWRRNLRSRETRLFLEKNPRFIHFETFDVHLCYDRLQSITMFLNDRALRVKILKIAVFDDVTPVWVLSKSYFLSKNLIKKQHDNSAFDIKRYNFYFALVVVSWWRHEIDKMVIVFRYLSNTN